MKNILSYWDILIPIIIIIILILLWKKYTAYTTKRDEEIVQNEMMDIEKTTSNKASVKDIIVRCLLLILICGCIAFIYLRFKGIAPSFIYIAKSYFDIPLGFIAIGLGIYLWKRYRIFCKKRNVQLENKGEIGTPLPIIEEEKTVWILLTILIGGSIVFIYNRLNGNLPNIVTFIKDIITY